MQSKPLNLPRPRIIFNQTRRRGFRRLLLTHGRWELDTRTLYLTHFVAVTLLLPSSIVSSPCRTNFIVPSLLSTPCSVSCLHMQLKDTLFKIILILARLTVEARLHAANLFHRDLGRRTRSAEGPRKRLLAVSWLCLLMTPTIATRESLWSQSSATEDSPQV